MACGADRANRFSLADTLPAAAVDRAQVGV